MFKIIQVTDSSEFKILKAISENIKPKINIFQLCQENVFSHAKTC
jgi:hypothetical protein